MNKDQRIAHLRDFIKDANADKWELMVAGQRVQIIKKMMLKVVNLNLEPRL